MTNFSCFKAVFKNIILSLACILTFVPTLLTASVYMDNDGRLKIPETLEASRAFTKEKKPWTFLVYMAADNDLYPFASRNLAQMKQIGSNENVNILVHLDIHQPGQRKMTKRLYIEPDRILQIGPDYQMDSGSEHTLINAAEWAINNFPSDHLAIVMWNHGSGDLNPVMSKTINPAQLFYYNRETRQVELDRSIGFMDYINALAEDKEEEYLSQRKRGICFDETNGTYLDDEKLMRGLSQIVKQRHGKNIDVMIFDACLMAGTGTSWIMSQFADYMVASEEVVLGPGYDYRGVLLPFKSSALTPEEFSRHIVKCYEQTYSRITQDYTHSAFQLNKFEVVAGNINTLAGLLVDALNKQKDNTVKRAIKLARNRFNCTYFDEPSYIDIGHFYSNLLKRLDIVTLRSPFNTAEMKTNIKKTLKEGIQLMNEYIISNVSGQNLVGALGLSVYFPEVRMHGPHHASYYNTEFAKNNNWPNFLKLYVNS